MALPFAYNDFHGGFNSLNQPFLLTDDEARDLLNVQGTTAGAITKRNGLVTFASPPVTLNSLFALESTGSPFLVGSGGTSLYSVSTGGTVTAIKTGLSSGQGWSFVSAPVVSAQGPLFAMNGVDAPQQWSGSGSTVAWTATDAGGAVPNGKFMAYTQNQVFVAGVAANPSRVYWSGIRDPTAWNPANVNGSGFMDFDPNDGQQISGIGVLGAYVVVAKPRKLWIIMNVAAGTSRLLSNNVGVASHRSMAVGPEGMYFLAEDRGVFVTNGAKVTPISDKIRPTLDGMAGPRSQAIGVYFGGHYYLSIPLGSGTNDTTLDFDSTLGSWWKHSIGSNQFTQWHPTATTGLYSAKSTSAVVDQCFAPGVWTDNGQAMTWVWRGPWQSPSFYRRRRFPTPYFRKRLRQVRCEGFGTVDFSVARDFAGRESLWKANIFAPSSSGVYGASDGSVFGASDGTMFGAPSAQRAQFRSLGVANAFSMVFGATSTSQDSVFEYVMMLVDRKDSVG